MSVHTCILTYAYIPLCIHTYMHTHLCTQHFLPHHIPKCSYPWGVFTDTVCACCYYQWGKCWSWSSRQKQFASCNPADVRQFQEPWGQQPRTSCFSGIKRVAQLVCSMAVSLIEFVMHFKIMGIKSTLLQLSFLLLKTTFKNVYFLENINSWFSRLIRYNKCMTEWIHVGNIMFNAFYYLSYYKL